MQKVANLDLKRVCDVSADMRTVEIRRKLCVTKIKANPDGTLKIINERTEYTNANSTTSLKN